MVRHTASLFAVALLCASAVACDTNKSQSGITESQPGVTEQQKETKANDQAQRDIAGARADFAQTREDYLHVKRSNLLDLDKSLVEMDAHDKMATGKAKADLDAKLPAIRAQRDKFVEHLQQMYSATPSTWDADKTNLDKEWDSLKSAVDSAQ